MPRPLIALAALALAALAAYLTAGAAARILMGYAELMAQQTSRIAATGWDDRRA